MGVRVLDDQGVSIIDVDDADDYMEQWDGSIQIFKGKKRVATVADNRWETVHLYETTTA